MRIFIGIYNVDNNKSGTFVTVTKDALIRFNIPSSSSRGQCYDGAKNIYDVKNSVSNKILA